MPTKSKNPLLPFGDQQTAAWYGKNILSVKQFNRPDLDTIFSVAHDADHGGAVGTFDLLKRQDPGQPLLRAVHADLFLLHGRYAAARRRGHPDQRSAILVCGQRREAFPTPSGRWPATRTSSSSATPRSARPPWRPSMPASPSSMRATVSASTRPRPCSIRSRSARNSEGSTISM